MSLNTDFGDDGIIGGCTGSEDDQMDNPVDVVAYADGSYTISDNNNERIKKYSAPGVLDTSFGVDGIIGVPDDTTILKYPSEIAVDGNGDVYVVDRGNDRIKKYSASGVLITSFGVDGCLKHADMTNPAGLAVDSSGNIYVGDTSADKVLKFNDAGILQNSIDVVMDPYSIASDGSSIYVAESGLDQVKKFDADGNLDTTFSGDGILKDGFTNPRGIEVDSKGNVYVSDMTLDWIKRYTPSGALDTDFDGDGTYERSRGDGNDFVDTPMGMSVVNDKLYIADKFNDRIIIVGLPKSNYPVTSVTVIGATSITTDDGTVDMSATVLPANATDKSVTWSVINGTGTAEISTSGTVTALTDGTITARATANDGSGVYGEKVITISGQVIDVTTVSVTSAAVTITKDDGTLQMTAEVLPANATDKSVTWSVINGSGTATISSDGLVTALTDGTITARATANDGSGVYGEKVIVISGQRSRHGGSSKKVVNVDGDKEVDKTKDADAPVINLEKDSDAKAPLSLQTIKAMKAENKTIIVENKGIKLGFVSGAIQAVELKEKLEKELDEVLDYEKIEVILGAKELSRLEKEKIIKKADLGATTGLFEVGGKVFDLTAYLVKEKNGKRTEQKIERFNEPVEVTLDLSGLKLTEKEIETLTAIRYEKDEEGNIKPVKLGGSYNAETKSFEFYTDTFSLYSVVKAENLLEIDVVISSLEAKVNKEEKMTDVAPRIINSRTMIPVRFIAENMGATVSWDDETRTVTIELDGKTMSMVVDEPIDGFDTPPTIVDNRTLVSLRYVSEKLGAYVMWFPEERRVHITK